MACNVYDVEDDLEEIIKIKQKSTNPESFGTWYERD